MGLTAVLAALRCVLAGQGHTVAQNMYAPPFRGSRLAVDGHVLIHRAGQRLTNARALVLPRTDAPDAEPLIRSITWMHRQMAERGQLKTQTVFDGAAPPGKNAEKATRREKASDALERVRASQAAGEEPEDKDVLAAAPCFFTAELVADVVDSLHAAGHTARVALTEADGQLAQLAKSGQVDHVLTCDSDLIAHGCPSVLLIPASGRQSHQQPDWLDWQTGGVVHHYQLSVLCSCNLAPEQLAAKQPKPKATETAGLALWLAAILAKHGPVALQVYGALTGCDYGSVCGAGPAVATAALHNLSALGNIEELSKAVSRALGPGYRARILHELEKEVHGPEAAAPAAGGPEAAAPAIALTVRRTLVCFGDALVYDQRPSVKRVVSLRAVAAAITAGGVDALPAVLDRDEHARARADLGGLSINDLVGEAPTDRVAGEIAANRTIPGSLAVRVPYWEDDTLHTAMLTDDLIPGARLQPPVFGKQWADLSDEEQEHVQMLDLDEESWATRFEKERWKSWDDLNEEAGNGCPDSARVLATASDLGFTEAVLWPPRPCDSAAAIEEHFIVDRLDRFLKCRDVKGMSTQSKRNKAEMVYFTMQQEAATLAKDEDVHLVSPEGADYVTLAGAAGRLDPAKFARATLQPPAAGQHWKTDRQEISGQCAYLGEEQVFGEWNGDPECGGEESREIDDGYNAIANLQDPDAEGLRWCKDPSDDQREWFVRQALASMKTEEGALLRYSCFLCVECVPVEQDDEMQVPTSRRFVTWGCECDAGRDLCLHVRGTAMLVAGLPRPAALRVPMGSTFGKNGWKRPGDGTCYSITSFYKNRPFIDSRLRKERRRQDKQKSKGERAVCKPVAMMDFYEPSPDDFPFPAWSAPQLVEMRGELWSGCKHPRLGICAAERLYRGRMPEESASAEVRAEGQRLREFWTTHEQAASQATARGCIGRRAPPAEEQWQPPPQEAVGRGRALHADPGDAHRRVHRAGGAGLRCGRRRGHQGIQVHRQGPEQDAHRRVPEADLGGGPREHPDLLRQEGWHDRHRPDGRRHRRQGSPPEQPADGPHAVVRLLRDVRHHLPDRRHSRRLLHLGRARPVAQAQRHAAVCARRAARVPLAGVAAAAGPGLQGDALARPAQEGEGDDAVLPDPEEEEEGQAEAARPGGDAPVQAGGQEPGPQRAADEPAQGVPDVPDGRPDPVQ